MKTRKSFWFKVIAAYVGICMLSQIFYPTVALALTGGPSQPEMQGFEPVGTTNMVDLASGSFTYNIPLMDVEGYPINLAYHSGITMDQEASWVGLGWSINPGEINRQMRGIPDDFSGDQVTEKFNMRDNYTVGLSAGVSLKVMGFPLFNNISGTAGVFYNNYKGPGITVGITPSLSCGVGNKGTLTAGLGLNFNSQSGVDISPSMGYSEECFQKQKYSADAGLKVGSTFNSRTGVKGISMSKDLGVTNNQGKCSTSKSGITSADANGDQEGRIGTSGTAQTSYRSFSAPTYIPTIKMPLDNYSVTLDATIGLSAFATHPNLTFTGWFNDQTLATNQQTLPAYGYMYADNAQKAPNALHDFNREKDIPFIPSIANLPITNFTYDLYEINGEGVSGQFRPFRGDVGILYDHENYNQSVSTSLGIELGVFPEVSHNGVEANVTTSNTVTDQWIDDNQFASTVSFKSLEKGNMNYEPFYIKRVGEKTVNDMSFYSSIDDVNPVSVHLLSAGPDVIAQSQFNKAGPPLNIPSNLFKTRREKRTQSTSIMTAAEANDFGLDKQILSYPLNVNVYASLCSGASGIDSTKRTKWPGWHTSQITVANPDGKRYVYGIPAYNTVHNESTFSVSGDPTITYNNDDESLFNYTPNVDNSISNSQGLDHYYDEQYLPPYAHSYLLTGILSPDYVDMTGNGISDDDLGEAVKFNYTRVYNQTTPYKWRVPFEQNKANYQKGLLTDQDDDKANYLYGEKEIWYVHSIESKTMVAQFILEPRSDAFGVVDENGGIDISKPLMCLKEINLYSKADLIAHGSNAVPVKTVHFEYSYDMCLGTPNSNAGTTHGKLTLKKVYFTYANNKEGSLNSYQFNYNGLNPNFSHNNADRWGNYKYHNTVSDLSNEDYPYSMQDNLGEIQQASTAWELTDIDLPSGGHITVNYESNDYAYLQDQRAGQMFLVTGMSSSPDPVGDNKTFIINTGGLFFNDWVDITIPEPETSRDGFYNDYLAGINQMYFRYAIDVDGFSTYEYTSGYAQIEDYQPASMTDPTKWAIKLKRAQSGDVNIGTYPNIGEADPVALSTWQFLRLNLPQDAYPGSSTTGSALDMIMALLGIVFDVIDIFTGFDLRVALEGAGQKFIPDHSWIRLDNPTYKKYGGGARVKEIDIADNWATMASGQSSYTYGQTYNYTTSISVNNTTRTISSGVATYEPTQGGDEISLKQPLPYDQKAILAPNDAFYTETPLGESLYPSPGVVYSKVTVTNLQHPGTERTSTGFTVNEFYTAYDFPVKNDWTDIDVERFQPSFLLSLFDMGVRDYTTASQGFRVEVNDMPGKEKGQEVYDQNGALISSTYNYYHTDNPFVPNMHLNNDVSVINPDGTVGTASIGKDIDTWEDMREQDSQTQGYGGTFNFEFFTLGFIPITIPIIIPSYSSEHTRFRSSVTTKYVYRTGLLDSVVNMKNGSYVTTQNVAYDAETGGVLLTKSNNEFNKPQYSFTYPAHFAYPGMRGEYQNIDVVVPNVTITAGVFQPPYTPTPGYFAPGDEIYCSTPFSIMDSIFWVTQPIAGGSYSVLDQNGAPVNISNMDVKVFRSGYRNMPVTPVGSVVTMKNPIQSGRIQIDNTSDILQSNGTLYKDLWQVPVHDVPRIVCDSTSTLSASCLANFLDSIITHRQVWATPADSITLGKYVHGCGDSNAIYYAITPPITSVWPDSTTYGVFNFYAMLGNCSINLQMLNGFPTDIYTPYTLGLFGTRGTEPCAYWSDVGIACISCKNCWTECVNLDTNKAFNPYAIGMLGDWRPERNYLYYTDRSPVLTASTSNIWKTGTYEKYTPIWDVPSSGDIWPLDTADKNWTWTSKITMYDPKGNEVEDKDALGRYSGALYGYMQSLPTAVSSNAEYREIAFDGFEDYGFTAFCGTPCFEDHFSFINVLSNDADTTSVTSHTGKYSLAIQGGHSITANRQINYYNPALYYTDATHFYLLNGGAIPLFSPDSGSYLLSAWVKENTCGQTGYKNDSIMVSYSGSSSVYAFHPSGPVIEGWQRFEGRFRVPDAATGINVTLIAGPSTAYYDDIRILPFAAEMKSYVYDQTSMRLMATLDENNYATIYEYNDEGILMRVKKETEKGIMTIKESRSSYFRKK